jgi:hypothetical protein
MNETTHTRRSWIFAGLGVLAAILLAYLAWTLGRQAGTASSAATATARPTALAMLPPTATPLSPATVTRPAPTTTRTATPTATATPTPTFTPTPTSTPEITAAPPLPQGFMITVRQPVQIVKTYDSSPSWWPTFPPFNLIRGHFTLVTTGIVSAGVDFRKLNPVNIHRLGNTIQIKLPAPQVYEPVTIDMSQSYIIDHPGINGQDLNQVIQAQGDTQSLIEDWALEHGILNDARTNAEQQVELMLRRLGFTQVEITWETPDTEH